MAEQRAVRREVGLAVALAPVALFVVLLVVAPTFMEPLFDPAVSIAGMPAGWSMLGIGVGLIGLGALTIARAHGTGRVVVGDVIAMVVVGVVILGPAAILIMKNLGSV